jgi:uncharacterized protein
MSSSESTLDAAVKAGDVAGIRAAVDAGADVNTMMEVPALGTVRPLSAAALYGHATAARVLLELGADIHGKDTEGRTALQLAAMAGREEVVGILIAAGAIVNETDAAGDTPLLAACSSKDIDKALATATEPRAFGKADGHPGTVRALLAAGADPTVVGSTGDTCLWMACAAMHDAIVDMLLVAGAGTTLDNMCLLGLTPLTVACAAMGWYESADKGERPVMGVAAGRNVGIVRTLLGAGAKPNPEGGYGFTALKAAACVGYLPVIDMLLDAGADVDDCDDEGSCLHFASMMGQPGAVKRLLEAGASTTDEDIGYKTPLDVVCSADGADKAHEAAIRELLLHPPPRA